MQCYYLMVLMVDGSLALAVGSIDSMIAVVTALAQWMLLWQFWLKDCCCDSIGSMNVVVAALADCCAWWLGDCLLTVVVLKTLVAQQTPEQKEHRILLFPLSLLGDIGDINSINSVDDCWYITFGLTWDVVLLVRVLEGLYIGVSCHSLPQCHFVLFWFVIFVVQSFLCHLAPGALATRAKVSVAPQIFSKSWAKRRVWRSWPSTDASRFQQLRGSGCAVRNGLTWRLPVFCRTLAEDAVMFPEVDLLFPLSFVGRHRRHQQH